MPVDFRDAAERHWEDAEYLLEASRIANADHLGRLSLGWDIDGTPVRVDSSLPL